MKILLHVCCGPCSTASVERLREKGYDVVLFFPNSNIYPEGEWEKRLENARKIAELHGLELVVGEYDHSAWREFVRGLENEKEGGARCLRCFEFNLAKTAKKARELGIENFTTTLTVSRFKNSSQIAEVGRVVGARIGVNFLEHDFKKQGGFEKSVELAKKFDLYRQNYCGCEFSLRN
ncbi:MAG: epoxyqueuosine reductase QueH [Nanoarchaeota archaeon]|nr:epoxyqueuosine reductase QueH [Nanoarchaeota archaeon]MBU0977982.1 epoxyqueuosine reductase QueH [Nanoarchaeota archaeon]